MTKEMQTLALVPQGSLEAYIRAANAYPMLTAEEERSWLNGCIIRAIWMPLSSSSCLTCALSLILPATIQATVCRRRT